MVRIFQKEDAEGVRDLILSILKEEYPFDKKAYSDSDINDIPGTYEGSKNAFFVFLENDQIVGTVGIKADSDTTALLRRFFVSPGVRRKGIGTGLLKESIGFCKQKGYSEIVFRATDRMKDAMHLIQKQGFTEEEDLPVSGFHIHLFKLKI